MKKLHWTTNDIPANIVIMAVHDFATDYRFSTWFFVAVLNTFSSNILFLHKFTQWWKINFLWQKLQNINNLLNVAYPVSIQFHVKKTYNLSWIKHFFFHKCYFQWSKKKTKNNNIVYESRYCLHSTQSPKMLFILTFLRSGAKNVKLFIVNRQIVFMFTMFTLYIQKTYCHLYNIDTPDSVWTQTCLIASNIWFGFWFLFLFLFF